MVGQACGRTQTPVDHAIGYTCVRPAGHSGPCAMVFVRDEPEPGSALDRALFSRAGGLVLLALLFVCALVFAVAWWLITYGATP